MTAAAAAGKTVAAYPCIGRRAAVAAACIDKKLHSDLS